MLACILGIFTVFSFIINFLFSGKIESIFRMDKTARATFGTKLGIIAATAGSAVGLGNIWRFPSQTAQDGGAIFVFVYLACVAFFGVPIVLAEFILGRAGKANSARA